MSCKIEFSDCVCGITFQLNCVGPEGPQGPAGETNDGANVGTGEGNVYRGKTNETLDFKTIKAGSGVIISDLADEVQIDATGVGGGEANTSSNEGIGGVGLALPKQGVNLPFKNVNAGSAKVVVSDDVANNEVDIDVDEAQFAHMQDTNNPHGTTAAQTGADPAGSAAAVQTNLDAHEADLANPHATTAVQVGADPAGSAAAVQTNLDAHEADLANPHATTAAQTGAEPDLGDPTTDGHVLSSTAAGVRSWVAQSPGGEVNDGANVGTGEGTVFRDKTGVDLNFKSLKAGTGVVLTNNPDEIQIDATGVGGGETNTSSNEGVGGVGLALPKQGVNLPFKNVNAGSNKVTVTDDVGNNEVDIDVNEANFAHMQDTNNPHATTAVQVGADPAGSASAVQTNLDAHEADLANPHATTAAQVGADPVGSAASVQTNLDAHEADFTNPHNVSLTQLGGVEEAPQDSEYYSRRNAAWAKSPQTPVGGLSVNYRFSTGTAATNPGIGNLKVNNADLTLATELYISTTTRFGNPVNPVFAVWGEQDFLNIRSALYNEGALYQITGAPTDNGGWFTFPIAVLEGADSSLADNTDVYVSEIATPSSRLPRGGNVGQILEKVGASDYQVAWADPSATGEANDGANVGTGEGTLFRDKVGVDLNFKTLKAGANIILTNNADEVQIDGTGAGGGEANTSSNEGVGGVGLTLPKSGVNLPFKSINAGSTKIVVTDDVGNNEVDIDVNESNFAHMQDSNNPHSTTAAQVGAEPVDATILRQADVDDTPVNGATTVPVSSNWAFDHENGADPHPGVYEPAFAKNSAFNKDFAGDGVADTVARSDHLHPSVYEPVDATILRQADVDDTPVDGATTVPISSNWAFDHNADPKHMPAGGTAGQYIRKQSATDYDVLWENLKISDDPTPILSGDLQTNGNIISLQDATPEEQGRVGYSATIDGVYLAFIADPSRGFDPLTDGGVFAKAGELTLSGSIVELNAFKGGSENLQLYVSTDGVLFGVTPPDSGWEVSDTDNADYTFPTLGTWVQITGLAISVPQDVDVGDRVDAFINLYFQEGSGNRGGSVDIGVGINGADPTTSLNNVRMEGGFDGVVSTSITTTTHGGLTAGDTIDVFVRRSTQDQVQFDPQLFGSIDPSELIVSVPGAGGGGGGDPTNLGNIPGASSVTITSSTGSNTVVAGAVSGTAGMMTGAQVDDLASKIDASGVTYENLDINGDVGPGVGQVEPGLGNPGTDGYVLSSTIAGVRSWIAPGGGGVPEPADDTYGYLREGTTSNQWVRGSRVFEQPTDPVANAAVGDVWIDTA